MAVFGAYDVNGNIVRASDGATVPADPHNADYQAAMAAVQAGATITSYVAQTVDLSALDQQTLNAALAEPGSVVRALGLLTFQEINKLRVLASQTAYTMPQFVAALKANMR